MHPCARTTPSANQKIRFVGQRGSVITFRASSAPTATAISLFFTRTANSAQLSMPSPGKRQRKNPTDIVASDHPEPLACRAVLLGQQRRCIRGHPALLLTACRQRAFGHRPGSQAVPALPIGAVRWEARRNQLGMRRDAVEYLPASIGPVVAGEAASRRAHRIQRGHRFIFLAEPLLIGRIVGALPERRTALPDIALWAGLRIRDSRGGDRGNGGRSPGASAIAHCHGNRL